MFTLSDVREITELVDLDTTIAENSEVVIRFTAPWCGPCRQLAPHIEKVAEKRPETTFVYVDVDKAPWAVVEFGIQSVPQVVLYRDGDYDRHLTGRTAVQILSELA